MFGINVDSIGSLEMRLKKKKKSKENEKETKVIHGIHLILVVLHESGPWSELEDCVFRFHIGLGFRATTYS